MWRTIDEDAVAPFATIDDTLNAGHLADASRSFVRLLSGLLLLSRP